VTGRAKTEVRDKLKKLQAEAEAGLKTSASYTLAKAVDDWAAEALDGLADKTVRSHVDLLKPVTMLIGNIALRDLTAHDVRRALNKLAEERSTRTMASTHNVLVRAIRHAEANDHVGRNVASFAVGLLCEMVGYGIPVVVVPHCKPQLASHPAFNASLETLRGGVASPRRC